MKRSKKSFSKRIVAPVALLSAGLSCGNLFAQWDFLSAIPYAGPYIDMARNVAEGNLGAIPYAGSYITMAQEIASGNFGAIPYAGGYINMAQEIASAGYGYYGDDSYYGYSGSPVADEINFSPEESASGVNVNLYEMTALYKTQFARAHQLNKLYPNDTQSVQDQMKGAFVVKLAKRVNPQFETLEKSAQGELIASLFWAVDKASLDELKERAAVVAEVANSTDAVRAANGYGQNVDYRRSVVAQLVLARYGFELGKHSETRQIGEAYLTRAKENARAYLESQAPLQYANWLDNFAIRAMISGDAERALENFQEARAIRKSVTSPNLAQMAKVALYSSDEYLARFYLTQFRFADARAHIDSCLKGYRAVKVESEEARLLIAEMTSNRALASFFEGRDYDAQRDLEEANAVFAKLPQYYATLTDFNARYPKNAQLQYDQSRQYVMVNNKWVYATQYESEKSSAEKRVRQFEWAFGKQVANHIRLAQIHSRCLRYEAAEKELQAAQDMKRATFDYLRKTDRARVFGKNPLFESAAYYIDSETKKPFIRENNNVVWLNDEEKAEREATWDRIFNLQIVFENNIRAAMALKQGKFDEAFALYDANVETIQENGYGEKTFMIETLRLRASAGLSAKDDARIEQASRDAAEAQRILALQENANLQYEGLVTCLSGEIALAQGRLEDAAKDFAATEDKYGEIRAANALWVDLLYGQARLARAQGRLEDARAFLDDAIARARAIRRVVSVVDRDRAAQFASYYYLYVTKASWLYDELAAAPKNEQGSLYAALFNVMEVSRAQGFLDIMKSSRIGLTDGMASDERAHYESELRASEEAARRAKLELVRATRDAADEETIQKLQAAFDDAQTRATNAYNDVKNASPAYREFIEREENDGSGRYNFASVAAEFARNKTLVCEYMIGENESFLFAYGRDFNTPRVVKLTISAEQAESLAKYGIEVEEGALTGDKLVKIFGTTETEGLFDFIRAQEIVPLAYTALALWEILCPDDAIRSAVQTTEAGTYTLVVPDGVLSQLPFEMLVTDLSGREPKYLIDEETVFFYAPSISVYCQLKEKARVANKGATLSVGNPEYSDPQLKPLPSSETEVNLVAEKCEESGVACDKFLQRDATELNVRENLQGKSFVHFACHGLVENKDGGMDCKLALTKGPDGNVANDGFLTLAELFTLDLTGCDCATLSACETNRGESQNGEGSWTLCRGALASGAANVIASDWSVSDESTSALIADFFDAFLKGETDYATALKQAKRAVKSAKNWSAPHYWAPFVLIGTAQREASAIVKPDQTKSATFPTDAPTTRVIVVE